MVYHSSSGKRTYSMSSAMRAFFTRLILSPTCALIYIDCTSVENGVVKNTCQRSKLDWLIYNDSLAYVELILNGDPELYI